jgi:hypothetical protein
MPNEIQFKSLTTCEVVPDGGAVHLNIEDAAGGPAASTLHQICLHRLVMTLPLLLSKSLKAQLGTNRLDWSGKACGEFA